MRCETDLEKGVNTTIGISGNFAFTPFAHSKGLMLSPLGIEITSSNERSFSNSVASSGLETSVNRGAYLRFKAVYSLKSCSSMRPSSSSIKASYLLAYNNTL